MSTRKPVFGPSSPGLTWPEIRSRATAFVREWADETAELATFLFRRYAQLTSVT